MTATHDRDDRRWPGNGSRASGRNRSAVSNPAFVADQGSRSANPNQSWKARVALSRIHSPRPEGAARAGGA